jgi:hypothetical protein
MKRIPQSRFSSPLPLFFASFQVPRNMLAIRQVQGVEYLNLAHTSQGQ